MRSPPGLHPPADHARGDWGPPEIHGDRCVHAQVASANCRRCVDACPRKAWQLDEESLDIDTRRCDGCGLCVPACTEGALSHHIRPQTGRWRDRRMAYAACEKAVNPTAPGVVPCLHAIDVQTLLDLYRDGLRLFLVARGECAGCARGTGPMLDRTVDSLNTLLHSRHLQAMTLHTLPAQIWRAVTSSAQPDCGGPEGDRRAFLRRAISRGIAQGMDVAGLSDPEDTSFRPLSSRLPRTSSGDRYAWVPVIREQTCNGCDACVKLCLHQAITLEDDDTHGTAYRIRAERCTGCGICTSACDSDAVSLREFAPQQQRTIPLVSARCRSCGAPYHHPAGRGETETRCRICARVDHNRNLYQVNP